jgi:hypothetical protein
MRENGNSHLVTTLSELQPVPYHGNGDHPVRGLSRG